MNGVAMLSLAALTIRRHWIAPWLTGALGVGLIIWIAVEIVTLPETMILTWLFLGDRLRARLHRAVLAAANRPDAAVVTERGHPWRSLALKSIHTVIFVGELRQRSLWLVVRSRRKTDRSVGIAALAVAVEATVILPTTVSARSLR